MKVRWVKWLGLVSVVAVTSLLATNLWISSKKKHIAEGVAGFDFPSGTHLLSRTSIQTRLGADGWRLDVYANDQFGAQSCMAEVEPAYSEVSSAELATRYPILGDNIGENSTICYRRVDTADYIGIVAVSEGELYIFLMF